MLRTWLLVACLLFLDCLLLTQAAILSKGKRSSFGNDDGTLSSEKQIDEQYWRGRFADSKLARENLADSDTLDAILNYENLLKEKLSDYNKNYENDPQYWRGRFARNNDPQFWHNRFARGEEEQGRFGREKQGRFGREEQGRFGREPKAQYWHGRFARNNNPYWNGRFARGEKEQGRFGREEQGRFGREEQGRFGREKLKAASNKQGRFGKKSEIIKADQNKKKSEIIENEELEKDKKSNIAKEDQGRFGKKSKIEYKDQGRFGKKSVIASKDEQGRFGRDRVGKNVIQRETIVENYKGTEQGRFGREKSSADFDESHDIENIDVKRAFDALEVEDSRLAANRKRSLKS